MNLLPKNRVRDPKVSLHWRKAWMWTAVTLKDLVPVWILRKGSDLGKALVQKGQGAQKGQEVQRGQEVQKGLHLAKSLAQWVEEY